MTAPLPSSIDPAEAKANWLLKYIAVQKIYDKQIQSALKEAMEDAGVVADKLGTDKIGERTKKYQAALVRNELRAVIKALYKDILPIVDSGAKDAAEAAAKASLSQDAKVLKALFPDPAERAKWHASFVASARHGIGAMVTRISVGQIPLSKRVYKSQAFTTGLLDRKVNSALARGASAKELADSVCDMINPDTPGGVSYAAMRLGRSEINNAFHAMSIQAAQQPWNEAVEWYLSKVHKPQGCRCEEYALIKTFDKTAVPNKPHPLCMCFIVPKPVSYNSFAEQLLSGEFDAYFTEKYGMRAA